jgi:diadenosine tetraphosphate (Ap4A) HIT family hydrolase
MSPVHPRLLEDCHVLGQLELCRVLLHRNASVPWFILVPDVAAGLTELHELDAGTRQRLDAELDLVARFAKQRFDAAKLNVAAIGNIVPQLHVHVVGRRPDDPCWPGVVWGRLPAGPAWPEATLVALADELAALGMRAWRS